MQSIIKKDQVLSGAARVAPAGRTDEPCQQGLRLLREGGLVHAIEITCSCGEVTLVELDYPPATEPDQ